MIGEFCVFCELIKKTLMIIVCTSWRSYPQVMKLSINQSESEANSSEHLPCFSIWYEDWKFLNFPLQSTQICTLEYFWSEKNPSKHSCFSIYLMLHFLFSLLDYVRSKCFTTIRCLANCSISSLTPSNMRLAPNSFTSLQSLSPQASSFSSSAALVGAYPLKS